MLLKMQNLPPPDLFFGQMRVHGDWRCSHHLIATREQVADSSELENTRRIPVISVRDSICQKLLVTCPGSVALHAVRCECIYVDCDDLIEGQSYLYVHSKSSEQKHFKRMFRATYIMQKMLTPRLQE